MLVDVVVAVTLVMMVLVEVVLPLARWSSL